MTVAHDPVEFRPTFGRFLCWAIWLVCVGGLIGTVIGTGMAGLRVLPWLLLLAGAVWAFFYNPRVRVDPAGVHLVNVLRTIDVPWPALQAVDTKWALTLQTAYGTYSAWAAPAPGGLSSARMSLKDARAATKGQVRDLVDGGAGMRPGDHPDTNSGAPALAIRRQWAALVEAGHLSDPQLERSSVPVRLHTEVLIGAGVLVVLCALTLVV